MLPTDLYNSWYYVAEELSEVSTELAGLQPAESMAKVNEMANSVMRLEAVLRKKHPQLFDGKKVPPNAAEIAILIFEGE